MHLSLRENQQVIYHTEMVENHHVIEMQWPILPFECWVISTLIAGDLIVESQQNFAHFHHVSQKGNVVILPSFVGCYYQGPRIAGSFYLKNS